MTKSNFKLLFAIPLFILFLMSCGSDKSKSNNKDGKEYTSAFICPMHCDGSGSDQAGKCPTCKMDYVANKEHKSDGHNHDHDGHDHSDHEGHDHGSHEGHDHDSHEGHDHGSHEGHNH